MSHGTDRRLSSRRWKNLRERVLRRDMHRCQWRLEGCTEYADHADHVYPRAWMTANDPRFWDERNLVAACGHCNRKRQSLGPGEEGNPYDGGKPQRVASVTLLSGAPGARPGPLRSRWSVIRADYSRKAEAG